MKNKKVIYALFDDGNQSVKKALEPLGYEVYSFGIQNKDTVINCDLTNLNDFIEKTKNIPKPDLIFANPPCETFSIATASGYDSGKKGNIYYYNDGTPIKDFEDWKTSTYHNVKTMKKDKKEYFDKLVTKREISEKLHRNTDKIIDIFRVPGVIENPMTSYCWKMFHKNYVKNESHYAAYDERYTKKPTFFATTEKLELKKVEKGWKQNKSWANSTGNYNLRSSVPKELIIYITEELLKNSTNIE